MGTDGRTKTKYEGVYQRTSSRRRYQGKPDICYDIAWYDPTGKIHREKVGWRSEGYTAELARTIRGEKIRNARHGEMGIPPVRQTLTLDDAWRAYRENWLAARGKNFSNDTYLYNKHLKYMGRNLLSNITPQTLDDLTSRIARKGLSPQTQRYCVALVRRILLRVHAWGMWNGKNPFESYTMPQVNNGRIRFLTPDEAGKLLTALRARSERMWMMALLSLSCGLRFGEIAALQWGDIDDANRLLHIRDPKNGCYRAAYLPDIAYRALRSMPHRGPSDLIFPSRAGTVMTSPSDSFARTVKALGLNEGIEDRRNRVVFHTLRHTFASWLAMDGTQQTMLSELLGHKSLEMTRRYTHLMPDQKHAAVAEVGRKISDCFNHDHLLS